MKKERKTVGFPSTEAAEQMAVVEWCDLMHIPVVHIPNEGKRSPATANMLKSMGLRKGFPDLLVTRARRGYNGLAIEMKYGRGKTSREQEEWLDILHQEGYAVRVCRSADEAINTIRIYNDVASDVDKQDLWILDLIRQRESLSDAEKDCIQRAIDSIERRISTM